MALVALGWAVRSPEREEAQGLGFRVQGLGFRVRLGACTCSLNRCLGIFRGLGLWGLVSRDLGVKRSLEISELRGLGILGFKGLRFEGLWWAALTGSFGRF